MFFHNNLSTNISDLVIDDNKSDFNCIKMFEIWDKSYNEVKAIHERAAQSFQWSQREKIEDQKLDLASPFYSLAIASLNTSVSWILLLSKLISDTYHEYVDAMFGHKKAWHLATPLVM